MREFDALRAYPQPREPRYVGPHIRTIRNRIAASYRDKEYYDGDRGNGYGGFNYDGRWQKIAEFMFREYKLKKDSSILQIGCEKGFLLHDFSMLYPKMKIAGYEVSKYAIEYAMPSIKKFIRQGRFESLPYKSHEFNFVIAMGVVYTLTLSDTISCLKEIQRVSKGKSFITLGAYRNEDEEKMFRSWSVLGATILHVDDWVEVLKEAGYTGDYAFKTSENLKLIWKNP